MSTELATPLNPLATPDLLAMPGSPATPESPTTPESSAPPESLLDGAIAFVDVESTGGNASFDRIIEIAIVNVRGGVLEEEWSTLVNPGRPVPPHITALTAIDDSMIEGAPTFAEVAREVLERLRGRLFVAHNVSFDRSFVRTELERAGERFSPRSLCTVRLSRRLHPHAHSHALDSVIQRFGITVERRHRALDDARVLRELWQHALERTPREELDRIVTDLAGVVSLPPQLPPSLLDEIPECPGIYRFYGQKRSLLYVGKSKSLRTRVLAHFHSAHRNATDRRLKTEVCDIEWIELAGELGAELGELRAIRADQPVYNKHLKHCRTLFSAQLDDDGDGGVRLRIREIDPCDREPIRDSYGLFRQHAEALRTLRRRIREHALCAVALGLESSQGSCAAHPLGNCRGACLGLESPRLHAARVRLALARERIRPWPFAGVLGIRERTAAGLSEIHVFREWRHLGSARNDEELQEALGRWGEVAFDVEVYRILCRYLRGRRRRSELIEWAIDQHSPSSLPHLAD